MCTQAQEASEKENVRSTKRVAEVCVCLMYKFEYILARYVVYQFETITLCVVCVCSLMHVRTYVHMSVAVL